MAEQIDVESVSREGEKVVTKTTFRAIPDSAWKKPGFTKAQQTEFKKELPKTAALTFNVRITFSTYKDIEDAATKYAVWTLQRLAREERITNETTIEYVYGNDIGTKRAADPAKVLANMSGKQVADTIKEDQLEEAIRQMQERLAIRQMAQGIPEKKDEYAPKESVPMPVPIKTGRTRK